MSFNWQKCLELKSLDVLFSPPPSLSASSRLQYSHASLQPTTSPQSNQTQLALVACFNKSIQATQKVWLIHFLRRSHSYKEEKGTKINKKITWLVRRSSVKALITAWTIIGPVIFLFDSQWVKSAAPVCLPTVSKSQLHSVHSTGISPPNPGWVISQPLLWFSGQGLFRPPYPEGNEGKGEGHRIERRAECWGSKRILPAWMPLLELEGVQALNGMLFCCCNVAVRRNLPSVRPNWSCLDCHWGRMRL